MVKNLPNILMVEDLKITRDIMGFYLDGLANIYYSENVYDAKKFLNKNSMDLIFTDLNFDYGEFGWGLVKWLRQTKKYLGPIYVTSGHEEESFKIRCKKAGATGYLIKPVDENEIRNIVKNLN